MVLNAQEKYQKTDDLFGESLEIDLPLYIKKRRGGYQIIQGLAYT